METLAGVKEFLLEFRMVLARENTLAITPRSKNQEFLAERGWMSSDVLRLVRNLSVADYADGPLPDDGGADLSWWIFGPRHDDTVLYVKVALQRGRVRAFRFMWQNMGWHAHMLETGGDFDQ